MSLPQAIRQASGWCLGELCQAHGVYAARCASDVHGDGGQSGVSMKAGGQARVSMKTSRDSAG
jgi:hypothetical protein